MLLEIPSCVHPHHFSSLACGALLPPQPVTFATVGKGSHVAMTPDCRHALSEKSPWHFSVLWLINRNVLQQTCWAVNRGH